MVELHDVMSDAMPMKKSGSKEAKATSTPAQLIDARIAELPDWRGETLAKLRAIIRAADSSIVEDWKWQVPVWEQNGILCTGEVYKKAVKLTFAKGAALSDPAKLFNSSLEGNTRRAIDVAEGAKINEKALKELIRAAVALNNAGVKKTATKTAAKKTAAKKTAAGTAKKRG